MDGFWILDPIYRGFDDPQYACDLESLKQTVAEARAFSAGLEAMEPLEGLRRGIALQERVVELGDRLANFAMLRQSVNTRDAEAGSSLGRVMRVLSDFAGPQASKAAWGLGCRTAGSDGAGGRR